MRFSTFQICMYKSWNWIVIFYLSTTLMAPPLLAIPLSSQYRLWIFRTSGCESESRFRRNSEIFFHPINICQLYKISCQLMQHFSYLLEMKKKKKDFIQLANVDKIKQYLFVFERRRYCLVQSTIANCIKFYAS